MWTIIQHILEWKKKKAYFNFFLNIEKYDQTSLGCILLNCYYFPSFIQIYTDVEKKMKIFKHALKSLKIQKQDLRRTFVEIYHIPIKLWRYEFQFSSLSLFSRTKKFKVYVEGKRYVQKFKQLHFWADKIFRVLQRPGSYIT